MDNIWIRHLRAIYYFGILGVNIFHMFGVHTNWFINLEYCFLLRSNL